MGAARVHVQPGFVETPGLASLEAVALVTPAVVADRAPVREYFGDDVHYAEPTSAESLTDALATAWQSPGDGEAAERIRNRYDWAVALAPLAAVYGL